MQHPLKTRRSESGYNLVETLIATAILGVILMSILTLFFIGRRNVYSGKQMSAANAVATRVLEDLALMSGSEVIDNFRLTNDTLSMHTYNEVDYASSVIRDTATPISSTTNDGGGYLQRWHDLLDEMDDLNDGRVFLIITPSQPLDNTSAATRIRTAQVVRIRGFVEWKEGIRKRHVLFDSSKLQRP